MRLVNGSMLIFSSSSERRSRYSADDEMKLSASLSSSSELGYSCLQFGKNCFSCLSDVEG